MSSNNKKYRYEDVKKFFNDNGFELVDKEYINSNTKIKFMCPTHGIVQKSFTDFKKHPICPTCSNKTRKPISEVIEIFSNMGYTLISDKYFNGKQKLEFYCPLHGIKTGILINIQRGHACNECGNSKIGDKLRHSIEYVRDKFSSKGYTLLEDTYIDAKTRMRYLCPKHGEQMINFSNLNSGYGCPVCGLERRSGSGSPEWKGGVSRIRDEYRSVIAPWTKECMDKTGYTCEVTGLHGNLNVHHMYRFELILNKTLKQFGVEGYDTIGELSASQSRELKELFIENNNKLANPVVMLRSVHYDFHEFCGSSKEDTTFEQLEEFKKLVVVENGKYMGYTKC